MLAWPHPDSYGRRNAPTRDGWWTRMTEQIAPKRVLAAAAAAVVYLEDLPEGQPPEEETSGSTRFAVHPHIEPVADDDPVLLGYLAAIYANDTSVPSEYPDSPDFRALEDKDRIKEATRALASELAEKMGRKNAARGIVFGCLFETADGTVAHGIVKVDLDASQRFHFSRQPGEGWSLEEVRDILPPPKRHYAKFVIAPQPGGDGAIGVRDENANKESAAEYVLEAFGITVPKTSGTKSRVGVHALRSGESIEKVHEVLQEVTEDRPTEDVLAKFGKKSQEHADRVKGAGRRPMPEVKADDPYLRIFRSRDPHLLVEAGPEVTVTREGANKLIIELSRGEISPDLR